MPHAKHLPHRGRPSPSRGHVQSTVRRCSRSAPITASRCARGTAGGFTCAAPRASCLPLPRQVTPAIPTGDRCKPSREPLIIGIRHRHAIESGELRPLPGNQKHSVIASTPKGRPAPNPGQDASPWTITGRPTRDRPVGIVGYKESHYPENDSGAVPAAESSRIQRRGKSDMRRKWPSTAKNGFSAAAATKQRNGCQKASGAIRPPKKRHPRMSAPRRTPPEA